MLSAEHHTSEPLKHEEPRVEYKSWREIKSESHEFAELPEIWMILYSHRTLSETTRNTGNTKTTLRQTSTFYLLLWNNDWASTDTESQKTSWNENLRRFANPRKQAIMKQDPVKETCTIAQPNLSSVRSERKRGGPTHIAAGSNLNKTIPN